VIYAFDHLGVRRQRPLPKNNKFDSNERVGGSRGNAASVVLVPGHLDVAPVAPAGSPRVLDEPVVVAVLGSVANDQDTVVEAVGGAAGLEVDPARIELVTML
jgi:hypothetical protein